MAQSIWGDSGITIVLLPSGDQGETLLEVAKQWTELRLLSPSMWVRPELLKESPSGPPRQDSIVLGAARQGGIHQVTVDLFEQLAREKISSVRLLVVRTLSPNMEFDAVQDRLVELLSHYLDHAVPQVRAEGQVDVLANPLVKLNLLVSPTEHATEYTERVTNPLFHAHFIASPEDRSSPESGNAFVHYEEGVVGRFAGLTMMHLATLGGLWYGLPRGGFELFREAQWTGNQVYVLRVFASAIVTLGLIQRACARVLDSIASPSHSFADLTSGLTVEGTYPIPDREADAWIDKMVDISFGLQDGALQYRPAVPSEVDPKGRFGLLRQLTDFVRFSVDKLARIPRYAFRWIARKFADIFTGLFQGAGKGSAEIEAPEEDVDVRDQALLRKYDEVFDVREKARLAKESPLTSVQSRSTPELWEGIRKLVFGFLDGSNLSQFGIPRGENGWPIFYRVDTLFSDPADVLEVPDLDNPGHRRSLNWMDSTEASQSLQHLELQASRVSTQLTDVVRRRVETHDRVTSLEEELEDLRIRLKLASNEEDSDPAGGGTDG